ncbi:MAG TPA: Ig-like domain-containing protein, partial [Aliidongia sp.]|nr:Ig-like domain-containing protein [Aliidongia sp.]
MSENLHGTFGTRRHLAVALGALCAIGTGAAVSSSAFAATSLVAAAQTPAVLANQSLNVSLTNHATVPAGQTARIKSLTTTGIHGKVTQANNTTITYTPGSYYATLAKGSSANDKFSYCLTDNAGASSCST